jgi:hypothetical protein
MATAIRVLLEEALRREWEDKTNRNPQWTDNLRIYGLQEIERRFPSDPLKQEIRRKLIEITHALS